MSVERQAVPHEGNPPWGVVTISGGIAIAQTSEPIDRWVDAADDALYRAKQAGRNQVSE